MKIYFLFVCVIAFLVSGQQLYASSGHVDSGINAFREGKFSQAIQSWNRALKDYSIEKNALQHAQVLFYLSEVHQRLGQTWSAVDYLAQSDTVLAKASNIQDKQVLQIKILASFGHFCSILKRQSDPESQNTNVSKYIPYALDDSRCDLEQSNVDKQKIAYLKHALTLVNRLKPENPRLRKRVQLSHAEWYLQQLKQAEFYEFTYIKKENYLNEAFKNYTNALSTELANEPLLSLKILNGLFELFLHSITLFPADKALGLEITEHVAEFVSDILLKNSAKFSSVCTDYSVNATNPAEQSYLNQLTSLFQGHCSEKQNFLLPVTHDAAYLLLHTSDLIRQLIEVKPQNYQLKKQFLPKAHAIADNALNIAKTIRSPHAKSYAYGYLGNLYLTDEQYSPELIKIYQDAIDIIDTDFCGSVSTSTVNTQSLLVGQRIETVNDNFNRNTVGVSEIASQWYQQKGKVHAKLGELDEAIAAYQKAINLIECVRQDIERCSYGSSCSFEQTVEPLYMEIMDLFMQRGNGLTHKKELGLSFCRRPALNETINSRQCGDQHEFNQQCDLYNTLDALGGLNEAELASYFLDPCIGITYAARESKKADGERDEDKISNTRKVRGDDKEELIPAQTPLRKLLSEKDVKNAKDEETEKRIPDQTPLRKLLSEKSVILYPLIYPNKLVMLIENLDGVYKLELISSEQKISKLIERITRFSRTIRNRSFPYMEDSQALYEILIEPLKTYLDSTVTTLVIVPDENLRMLPWAALFDSDDERDEKDRDGKKLQGKYLIEQYALAITPNTMIPLTVDYQDSTNQRLLLAGLSDVDLDYFISATNSRSENDSKETPDEFTINYRGLSYSNLPFVKEELLCVDKQVNANRRDSFLLEEDFTYQTLQNKLTDNKYRILHIASHALFRSDIKQSVIITGNIVEIENTGIRGNQNNNAREENGDIYMNQLEDLINASRKYDTLSHISDKNYPKRPSIEMLVLSACSTAIDEEKSVLGLSGIAVKAGVPSVVGTLWEIDDMSTSVLMSKFYNALDLQKGKSKLSRAEALQQAQIHMLSGQFIPRKNDADTTSCEKINRNYLFSRNATPIHIMVHPYYWSPFIVIGNWRAFGR